MEEKNTCKYNCSNGRIFDTGTRSWVVCPECKDKKLKEVNNSDNLDNLKEDFGIDFEGLSGVLVPEAIIPENERNYIEPETFSNLKEGLMRIYARLNQGKGLKGSYCFGLGVKGRINELVFPLQKVAYTSGLTVSKFITAIGLSQMLLKQDIPDDLFTSDLCIILINEGCSKADVSACKGVMQERASKGLSTVFVTTWSVEACSNLLGYEGDESLYLAKPVFIAYKYSGKKSNYINNLFGVDNALPDIDL